MNRHRVVAILLALLPAASQAGISFDLVTETNGKVASTAKIWVEGNASKMLYDSIAEESQFLTPGSYYLTNDDGTFIVTPAQRTFARYDSAMMEQMSAELFATPGAGGAPGVSEVNVEKTIDEPGETIEGRATRHYQFKATWKMSVGGPVSMEHEVVEDVWIATELEAGEFGRTLGAADLPTEVKRAYSDLGRDGGLPLRSTTVDTTKTSLGAMGLGLGGLGGLGALSGLGGRMAERMATRGSGRRGRDNGGGDSDSDSGGTDVTAGLGGLNTTTTTHVEVSRIEELAIPANTFALPMGYRETQPFQTGPALPSLNDIAEEPAVPALNNLND